VSDLEEAREMFASAHQRGLVALAACDRMVDRSIALAEEARDAREAAQAWFALAETAARSIAKLLDEAAQ
jgi:hypothetical protein